MALFHMNVTQIKRSKGQSAIAAVAYRAGEKLHSEYYGEVSDYTNKHGVICSEILLPTIHEGPAVRQMEAKGIRTDKGEFNHWIKATNSLIQSVRKKIAALLDWLKEAKEEMSKPQTPDLISLLQMYFDQRNSGAYSQKARANNLKELSEIITFLQENGITDVESKEISIL